MLRHKVAILRRTNQRARADRADRTVFATLVRRLPRALRCHRLVTATHDPVLASPPRGQKMDPSAPRLVVEQVKLVTERDIRRRAAKYFAGSVRHHQPGNDAHVLPWVP